MTDATSEVVPDPVGLRALAATLAERTDQDLGADLLAGFELHGDRERDVLRRWSAAAIEFADETIAADPGLKDPQAWAVDRGIEIEDVGTSDAATAFVMSQYHVRVPRVVVIGPTLTFACTVFGALGWQERYPREVLRRAAIGHELAHHLLAGPGEKELRLRLARSGSRPARRRHRYVIGADEIFAHRLAGQTGGEGRSGLLMAAVLQEAVTQLQAHAARPDPPDPPHTGPRSSTRAARSIANHFRSRPWEL